MMKVLSLFDGMSCLQIALKELGYPIGQYYASEIDKHAINQTQLNFPNTIQLGDVTKWREWDIDWHFDLIGAGSPCQGFSFAGKQLAFDDPRSKLFFVFIEILNHVKSVNPDVKFLLENVRMKAEHEAVITQYTGVNPIYINSALVSAQHRDRLYWTNIGMAQEGLFGEWYPGIPQPEDRGILLRDILESEVDEKYYLSDKMMNRITFQDKGNGEIANLNKGGERGSVYDVTNKISCLAATDYKQPKQILQGVVNNYGVARYVEKSTCIDANYHNSMDNHAQRTMVELTPFGNSQDQKISPIDGKIQTMSCGHFNQPKVVCVAMRGRNPENPSGKTLGAPTEQRLEPNLSSKTNCLTSVQKDNLILLGYLHGGKWDYAYEMDKRVYSQDGKMCTIQTMQDQRIRRLTPLECSRLQTIPAWYKWDGCSDTQAYKMLGNGWTIEVIKHILKYLI